MAGPVPPIPPACDGLALSAGPSPATSLPPPSQPGALGSSPGLWHQGLTHGSCLSLLLGIKEHARVKVQCGDRAEDDPWISFPQKQAVICSCTLLLTGVGRWWCSAVPGLVYYLLSQQRKLDTQDGKKSFLQSQKNPYPVLMLDVSSSGSWSSWQWQWPNQQLKRPPVCWYKAFLRRVGRGHTEPCCPAACGLFTDPQPCWAVAPAMLPRSWWSLKTSVSYGGRLIGSPFWLRKHLQSWNCFFVLLQVLLQMEKRRRH